MNRDDVIRLAREAGIVPSSYNNFEFYEVFAEEDAFERFAALIAAAEREACAKVCEEQAVWFDENRNFADASGAESCAAAIRARGEK